MKLFLLVLIAFVSILSTSPASPEEDEARAKVLVKQLRSDSFKDREQAAKELIALGAGSKKALEEGCKSTDAEVAERCRTLIPQAHDAHIQRLIEACVASPKLPLSTELPGAVRWLEVVGNSEESRALYLEIATKHREILIKCAGKPEILTEQFRILVRHVHNRRWKPKPSSEMALLLFMASDPRLDRGDRNIASVYDPPLDEIFEDETFYALINSKTGREPFKKLFVESLAQETKFMVIRAACEVTQQLDLKEALPALLKIAKDKDQLGISRSYAILNFARIGGKKILPELVPFFEDRSVVMNCKFGSEVRKIEMRDFALGMALLINGQKLTEFGFDRDSPNVFKFNQSPAFETFSLANEARKEALKKWTEFANKEKLLPEAKK